MNLFGKDSGIVNFFLRSGGESITIYREDCDAGWDRETGRYIASRNAVMQTCALVKPNVSRSIIQDDGGERARGTIIIQTTDPIYTSDERDNASSDVVFLRNSYWKVMEVTDYYGYFETELQLLPDDACKDLGLPHDKVS